MPHHLNRRGRYPSIHSYSYLVPNKDHWHDTNRKTNCNFGMILFGAIRNQCNSEMTSINQCITSYPVFGTVWPTLPHAKAEEDIISANQTADWKAFAEQTGRYGSNLTSLVIWWPLIWNLFAVVFQMSLSSSTIYPINHSHVFISITVWIVQFFD